MESIVPMATHVLPRPQGHGMVPLLPTPTAQPYKPPPEAKEEPPGGGTFASNWKNPYLPYHSVQNYPDDHDKSFRAPEQRQTHLTALKELQSENPGFEISPKDEHGVSNYFNPGWFSGKVPKKKAYDDVMGKFRALQDTTHPVIERKTKAALTISRFRRGKKAREQIKKKKLQQQKTAKITKQVDKLLPHLDYAGGKSITKRRKKRKKKRRKKTRKHKRRKRRKTRKR